MNLKGIGLRTFSGLIYVGIIVGAILAGGYWILLLVLLFGLISTLEFTKISRKDSLCCNPCGLAACLDVIIVACIIRSAFFSQTMKSASVLPLALTALLICIRMIVQLYSKDKNPLNSIALSALKYLYLGFPLGCMGIIGYKTPYLLLAIFLLIWINDTGAYLFGCTFGKHKLFERISPKKTWEGFFGGFITTTLSAVLFGIFGNLYLHTPIYDSITLSIGLGALVSVFGTWGDLFESMIKRTLLIKDSGNIIPGHGGILDRIDSLLFVLPPALIYISILQRICD